MVSGKCNHFLLGGFGNMIHEGVRRSCFPTERSVSDCSRHFPFWHRLECLSCAWRNIGAFCKAFMWRRLAVIQMSMEIDQNCLSLYHVLYIIWLYRYIPFIYLYMHTIYIYIYIYICTHVVVPINSRLPKTMLKNTGYTAIRSDLGFKV